MIITDTSIAFDPRPDLSDDSWLWDYLLSHMADNQEQALFHAIRCAGFRLVAVKSKIVLRKTMDRELGFATEQDYESFKKEWMDPKTTVILETLHKITATFKIIESGHILPK